MGKFYQMLPVLSCQYFFTLEDMIPSSPAVTDTQELCKRLEERIISLTRMGDNLQKENRGSYFPLYSHVFSFV